jgi:hypothetical protein
MPEVLLSGGLYSAYSFKLDTVLVAWAEQHRCRLLAEQTPFGRGPLRVALRLTHPTTLIVTLRVPFFRRDGDPFADARYFPVQETF